MELLIQLRSSGDDRHMTHHRKETTAMNWEGPSFVEVKMDSEINSYQDDFRDGPDANGPSKATSIIAARQEQ